ncbi:MAG: amidohydrolase family protein [Novosphingobium sp.]|nr:amidohydrolase family protein [Novosphingobium sp.]
MSRTADFDLVIRGGTIVDGSGGERFEGDVAVRDGRIAAVGDVRGSGVEEIDARGRIITPGFVDIHTHYDGHATWTNRLEPSSQHGVTTVLVGNCGVGFAPCKAEDRERLMALMEGVEDIPEPVMSAGIPWAWESFPDYLDFLDQRAFDMDIATQVPHAPLRVFVMGERAAERDPASEQDIAAMGRLAREAIAAGALGFSTSRTINHKAADGTLTPTYAAACDELIGIARAIGEGGKGVLQMISDFDNIDAEFAMLRQMQAEARRPLTFTVLQMPHAPERWRALLDRVEQARKAGQNILAQVCGRPPGVMMALDFSRNPFMHCPAFRELAGLDDATRLAALRDPGRRARILAEYDAAQDTESFALLSRFDAMYELGEIPDYEPRPEDSLLARAWREGRSPEEVAYEVLIDRNGVIYIPAANYVGNSIEAMRAMIHHPAAILGLGDGGAHCGLLCDASMTTYYLVRWARTSRSNDDPDCLTLEQLVRKLAAETAQAVGLDDRGVIRVGKRADLNVIDIDTIGLGRPTAIANLPNGARMIGQGATGYDATICAGEVTYRMGEATGALPGRLVRGARASMN